MKPDTRVALIAAVIQRAKRCDDNTPCRATDDETFDVQFTTYVTPIPVIEDHGERYTEYHFRVSLLDTVITDGSPDTYVLGEALLNLQTEINSQL